MDITNTAENRHNYQRLAIEILRRTIRDYKRGDRFAQQFLFAKTCEKGLTFWSSVAGVSIKTVRKRARNIKKLPSSQVGAKYNQVHPSKHKRVGRGQKRKLEVLTC